VVATAGMDNAGAGHTARGRGEATVTASPRRQAKG
jgi:hypothetical protein